MNRMDMQAQIENKLRTGFADIHYLEIVDETSKHNVPPDAQSHFKLTIVSNAFEGSRLIDRHRKINALLAEEIKHIHALALNTLTAKEWDEKDRAVKKTPPCLGGSNAD